MNTMELAMRRKNVRAFIDADRFPLVVSRAPERIKNTETGGWIMPSTRTPLPSQRARIVQNVRRYTAGIVNSEAGDIPHTNYLLIGMHTLDLQVTDEFEWLGETYHVVGIFKARRESTLAAIDLLGVENRNG